MPDTITAQDQGTTFTPHDEGQFAAACADVIDLGRRVEQYPGKPARVVPKCALVFLTNSKGETKEIGVEFTVTMGELAKLRQTLEAWRGKSYTPEQAAAGVPLHKLVGHAALISVEHKRSAKGRTYAKLKTISPLPDGLVAPMINGYTRAEFWAERKKQYAEEAARFQQTIVAKNEESLPDQPDDMDDSLPF